MNDLMDLSGRKIMITGASSGIGRAAAILASEKNASLVLCGRDEERLAETLQMLKNKDRHILLPFDIRDFDSYNSVFDKAVSVGNKLSGLVHCAGIAKPIPMRMMNHSRIIETIDTNLTSFALLVSMYTQKKYSDGGSIVGISSANSHLPQKYMSIYAASKAGIEAIVKTASLELYEKNIRINCVVPGAVDTPMARGTDPEQLEKIIGRQLLGLTAPAEIANVIVFLISNASSAVTGAAISADGGRLGQ